MNRHQSAEWKELIIIQNMMPHVDILTITSFMNDEQFIAHLNLYRKYLS